MKISKITLEVLSNFSRVSEYVTFNRDNKGFISVSNDKKTMYAYYVLPENENVIEEFTAYKLNDTLKLIKDLESDFEFVFDEKFIVLKDKNTTLKFKHAAKLKFLLENSDTNKDDRRLLNLPKLELLGEPDISFFIESKELQKIIKLFNSIDMETIKFSLNNDNEVIVSAIQDNETKSIERVISKNEKEFVKPIEKVLYLSSLLDISKSFDYRVDIWDCDIFLLSSFVNVKNGNNEIEKKEINLKYIAGCKAK